MDYVKRGGKVIALENALSVFAGEKTSSLAKAIETRTTTKSCREEIKSDDTTLLKRYEYELDRRYSLSDRSAGSIYKVRIDDTHPYAFGLGKDWYIMKRTAGYPFLTSGSNIGYILDGRAGWVPRFKYKDKIKNTLVIETRKTLAKVRLYILPIILISERVLEIRKSPHREYSTIKGLISYRLLIAMGI